MRQTGKFGVVAAGHEITAEAAVEVLQDGGNAFDAVIAGLCAACIPEVVLASLGGGGFLMAQPAGARTARLYDFFVDTPGEQRPQSEQDFRTVSVNFGTQTQDFQIGVGATAVPGLVPGLFAIHNDLATLPIKRLVEPAIRVAREGVRQNAYQAYLFSIIPDILSADPQAAEWFAPQGRLLQAGELVRNPHLAETFAWLAEDGARLFVDGPIGQAIVRQSRECGGHLTERDLVGYRVERRAPLRRQICGAQVDFNPAPAASGPLLAFAFELLEGLPIELRRSPAVLADVMARTNVVRASHDDVPACIADTIIKQHLEEMRRHNPAPRGTTHISVIDVQGNAAAATVSNGEGNGVMVGEHGFMLNNMLGEEDLNPGGFHRWRPGRRMSTMMAPTLVTDHDGGCIALGSGGSNRIRSAVMQVLLGLLAQKLSAQDAVTAPRLHVEKCGNLSFEAQFSESQQNALLSAFPDARRWAEPNMFFGGVHVARRLSDGSFEGVGDARRAGHAIIV